MLALSVAGCADETGPAAPRLNPKGKLYYDVRGLVEQQMQQLAQQGRAVTKRVSLRDGGEETVRVADVKWANELQVFLQADINKAALRGAYAVDSAELGGGLQRYTYTRRLKLANAPVTELVVVREGKVPREISAAILQGNPLFDSSKQLRMKFSGGSLQRYEVSGMQKLVLFDALRYRTDATVE
ncbi:hypothetical protein GCM10023185_10950 [Hymenobacter saemangeumensis]|uniref:DUF4292 domain-containing protein n=1 Tax=Hymenobacter saemangeumensis TaxID=1084522 RepID=A0ABP8I5H0_9BACT